ncbi:hypothetical protein ACHWQZ_G006757 [Mnemiopsis leidyi]
MLEEDEQNVNLKVELFLNKQDENPHITDCHRIEDLHLSQKIEERINRRKLVSELKDKSAAGPNKHYLIRKCEVVLLNLFTVFEDVINDANSNAGLQYWTEAKEDLGEIVTEEKHVCKPNKALYPVQTKHALNLVHNMAPSTVENSLFQYNAISNAKESKADFIVGELSDKITCDVSLCETPGKKKTFIRRKPAYKVYKERHPFIRKLARYSSDMLRREIPDYSFSLYVSL